MKQTQKSNQEYGWLSLIFIILLFAGIIFISMTKEKLEQLSQCQADLGNKTTQENLTYYVKYECYDVMGYLHTEDFQNGLHEKNFTSEKIYQRFLNQVSGNCEVLNGN